MVYIAVLLAATVAVVTAAKNDNLIAVVQLFRHGQRTPVKFYSADPYSNLETYWGGLDYGDLTNEGKRQHFSLGQFTRNRYSDWLPTYYDKDIIFAQTTDVERTHMSAQSNLNGIFGATGKQVWRKNLDWQPIPIHPSDPKIISGLPTSCPLFDKLLSQVIEEIANIMDPTYSKVYEYISKNSNETITTFTEAGSLYDPLYIEQQVGFTLPSWTNMIYPEPVGSLYTKYFESFTYNTQLQRLSAGVLLNTIIGYFEQMVKDPISSPKYQIYSAHDSNVFGILNSIGQKPDEPVPFATSLWFELRRVNFVDVIQLWMKSGDKFTQLNIQGCALNCPLTEVKNLLNHILIDVDTVVSECNDITT